MEALKIYHRTAETQQVGKFVSIIGIQGYMFVVKNGVTPLGQMANGQSRINFPGPDGKVRSCKGETQNSLLVQSIARLCRLPIDTPDEDEENASETGFFALFFPIGFFF